MKHALSSAATLQWSAPITVNCLTPQAVFALTGLDWHLAESASTLPTEQGVYVWAQSETSPIIYHGSASAQSGLRRRLGNEMRWCDEYLAELAGNDVDNSDPYGLRMADWVPMIRGAVDHRAKAWYAVARPCPWADTAREVDADAPTSAREWEAFISECSRLITGHRSLLGGGAWNASRQSVEWRIGACAMQRVRDLCAPTPLETEMDCSPR